LKRFERKDLGYSKSLEMHKLAVALHFGVYNFVGRHHTLGTTPTVAAGLEEKPWSLERVVEMTADHAAEWLESDYFVQRANQSRSNRHQHPLISYDI
jgi:hypothetical protein